MAVTTNLNGLIILATRPLFHVKNDQSIRAESLLRLHKKFSLQAQERGPPETRECQRCKLHPMAIPVLVLLSLPPVVLVLLPVIVLPIVPGVVLISLPVLPRFRLARLCMIPRMVTPPLVGMLLRTMLNLAPLLLGLVVVVVLLLVTTLGVTTTTLLLVEVEVLMLKVLLTRPISLDVLSRERDPSRLRTLLAPVDTTSVQSSRIINKSDT